MARQGPSEQALPKALRQAGPPNYRYSGLRPDRKEGRRRVTGADSMLTTHYTYTVQVSGSSGTLSKDLQPQLCNHAGTYLKPSGRA